MGSTGPEDARPWLENSSPTRRWPQLRLGQLWGSAELIYFFALRDVKVRYKQAFLGAAWAVLHPLAGGVAFTVLFHRLVGVEADAASYLAFALVGFLAWTYFSSAVSTATSSLLWNAELLTKVALPRMALPVAALLPPLIDLAVGTVLALVVLLLAAGAPSIVGLAVGLPAGMALIVLAAAGPALGLSALVVRYRDVSVIIGFALQLLLLVSPVGYPPDLVPRPWYWLQYLNPLTGALALLRWGLAGTPAPEAALVGTSVLAAVVIAFAGAYYFRANEREIVDII